jgi:rhodanese-related sulfurtransferase
MHTKTVLVLGSLALALGCRSTGHDGGAPAASTATEAKPSFAMVNIPQVSEFVRNRSAVIVDANGAETRNQYGVIPGAVLLTSHDEFAVSELPGDKHTKLVFYCGGKACTASHVAAARAAKVGYTDVAVLPDGIRGWKQAGQPTETPKS